MRNRIIAAGITASILFGSVDANAQSLRGFEANGASETRVAVGITIPLGTVREQVIEKPRFDFAIETARVDGYSTPDALRFDPLELDRRNVRRASLSFTFEDQPHLLLNGAAPIYGPTLHAEQDDGGDEAEDGNDGRNERTTGQQVGRAAAAAGLVVGTIALVGLGILVVSGGPSAGDE